MENVIRKNVTPEIKDLGEGVMEAVIASDSVDRHGEILDINGMDINTYKNDNPVVAWAHDYHAPAVAQTLKIWKSEGKVIARFKWADEIYDFARLLYRLYRDGFMRMFSVGFIPSGLPEENEDGIPVYKKSEMVEFSAVLIGSNRDALLRAKEIGLNTDVFDKINKGEMTIKDSFNVEIKPYPNEHSCRLENPDKYERFARKNCFKKHDGKCIDFIFGIKAGKSELQAMRYPKKVWTPGDAKNHCKAAKGTFEPATEKSSEYGKCPECNQDFQDKVLQSLKLTEKALSELNKLLKVKKQKVVKVYLTKAKRLAQFADKSNEITIKTIKRKIGKE